MKFLLAALNAKYIHSNPGIYSLKAYAEAHGAEPELADGSCRIELGEYTINNQFDDILSDIYRRKPDVVGFSCYIWNITFVMQLVRDLPKVLPDVEIWLGGPQVSYDASQVLKEEPAVFGIMMGEGEESFTSLVRWHLRRRREGSKFQETLEGIPGIAVRNLSGEPVETPLKNAVNMSEIPFLYDQLEGFKNRIIYYESSRGCPFSCSYCLSSLDKSVRFRDMELVKRELDYFLEHKVSQVKFVDRTFNCNKKHTMEIWRYITEHDNGITNFHFEISADLLDEEELELMKTMRPGLIQLEIGVQSTNPNTIKEIQRKTDLKRLKAVVDQVNGFQNIHQHLDLIAGLPYENYESFKNSFNTVYEMKPEQLQLGFLKVLKGSYMEERARNYDLVYKSEPPYEVLSTAWLNYGEILKLKAVEEMVEVYGNSGQFRYTMEALVEEFQNPFDMFESLAQYYEAYGLFGLNHTRIARYEILEKFVAEKLAREMPEKQLGDMQGEMPEEQLGEMPREHSGEPSGKLDFYKDLFVYDLYLRENMKSRPAFSMDQLPYKEKIREFFAVEAKEHRYLKEGYEGFEARQLIKMAHLEVLRDGRAVLFDYKNRDPLTYNAAAYVVELD